MAPGGTDERVSTEFEVWAAERVVAQHDRQHVLDRPLQRPRWDPAGSSRRWCLDRELPAAGRLSIGEYGRDER